MSLFWEFYQQGQIADAKSAATEAGSKVANVQYQIRQLREGIDKLILVNMAMWNLIEKKTNLTQQDLMDEVERLDLRDGKRDGKITQTPLVCPQCKRTMAARRKKCLYCGYALPEDSAFDAL